MSGVHVDALRLSHFRSWLGATVETEGRTVALFGPNGAGKTNLLEAVSMLSPGRGLRRAGVEDLARTPERLGWRVVAETATPAPVEIVTGADAAGARRTVSLDGKTAPQSALGRILRQVWLTPAMDRLWMDTAGERRRFLDRLTLGFFPDHGEVVLAYEKAMRERNRLLRDGVRNDAWLSGLEVQMGLHGTRLARARAEALGRLKSAAPPANSLFPRADLRILGDMEARFSDVLSQSASPADEMDRTEPGMASALARTLAEGRGRDAVAGRTLNGPHRSDLDAVYGAKAMPARVCSTGEQKALLISLCLANARAIRTQTGHGPVLLLDEVAAHLDAGRRRALYAEIAALGCQAWMTGTGPELFDDLDARRFAVRDEGGASVLAPA